jgi:hypothetical protein
MKNHQERRLIVKLKKMKVIIKIIFLTILVSVCLIKRNKTYYLNLKSDCNKCRNENILVEKLDTVYRVWTTKSNNKYYDFEIEKRNIESITCDLFNVFRRGPKQNIIGISLYGLDDRYYKSLKLIANQASHFYPEWTIRIYYDNSINKSIICDIECLKNDDKLLDNVDFCYINNIPNGLLSNTWSSSYMHNMKWRWLPLGDPFVDIFISRDSDSWFSERESEAVKMWLKSEYLFHVMRGTLILLIELNF